MLPPCGPVDGGRESGHTRAMYQERAARLSGAVVWTRTEATTEEVRVLPDGCMDLIWSSTGDLFVAGPDTVAFLHVTEPGRVLTGLRFAPGVAPAVLGVAAHELADGRVGLDQLWCPTDARRLADRLADNTRPGRVLEAVAHERLGDQDDDGLVTLREVVRLLRARRSVRSVAAAVGMSERQLRRRSIEAFGYGPKMLARILRAQRAIALARSGEALADVAFRAGYADQAHLAREVRALAGVPVTQLLG
jgi:AraC-like DNA-binding protein